MRFVSIASGSSGNCIYIGSEAVSYTHLDVYKRQPSAAPVKSEEKSESKR